MAITRGSTVDFPNGDPFFHNVFSLSRAANFNLGRFERGQSRSREFTKAGTVKVYCDIHSHMSATILVFDHPYFTIPELDGSFELPAVPVGPVHAGRDGTSGSASAPSASASRPVRRHRST